MEITLNENLKKDDRPYGIIIYEIKVFIMILFQKICKRLFFLWFAFFCPFVFSNPLTFNPMLFAPHPLPSQVVLPQNTPLMPFCPQNIPIQLCMALTSFPLVETNPNSVPSSTMFTPFSHKPKDISSNRRKRLLSKYRWKSYEYSNEDNKLMYLSKTKRNAEPEEDYYRLHIQEKTDDNTPSQVIQESQIDGKKQSHVGELRAVRANDILRIIESTSTQTPVSQPPHSTSPPPETTQTETAKQSEEEKPESAQPIIISAPVTAITLNYNSIPKQCSDLRSGNTEAISICVSCTRETNEQLQRDSFNILRNANRLKQNFNSYATLNTDFNFQLSTKLKSKICHGRNIIEPIEETFDTKCGNISFENYLSDVLICESCNNGVPPALILSMMSLESGGACDASGDGGKSHGLFQINSKYHDDPPVCNTKQKTSIQDASLRDLKNSLQCSGNPVANMKKGIEILKTSYLSVNGYNTDFNCQSPDMNTNQINQWRKALAGYNGGSTHVNRLKKMQRPQAIPEKQWNTMDEWEKIRVQYFFYTQADPSIRMGNLAYVETALGSSGEFQSQLHLFNSWKQTLGNQNTCEAR